MKYVVKPGDRFGRLVAVAPGPNQKQHKTWILTCDCGATAKCTVSNLCRGQSRSCGCFRSDRCREVKTTHGKGGSRLKAANPTYVVWLSMHARCGNASSKAYYRYGGRGISVCAGWRTFEGFLADMGERPSKAHSIDRVNNARGYECGNCAECHGRGIASTNCRWATKIEKARNVSTNRLVTVAGVTRCVAEWCETTNVPPATAYARLKKGWDEARAVTEPVKRKQSAA